MGVDATSHYRVLSQCLVSGAFSGAALGYMLPRRVTVLLPESLQDFVIPKLALIHGLFQTARYLLAQAHHPHPFPNLASFICALSLTNLASSNMIERHIIRHRALRLTLNILGIGYTLGLIVYNGIRLQQKDVHERDFLIDGDLTCLRTLNPAITYDDELPQVRVAYTFEGSRIEATLTLLHPFDPRNHSVKQAKWLIDLTHPSLTLLKVRRAENAFIRRIEQDLAFNEISTNDGNVILINKRLKPLSPIKKLDDFKLSAQPQPTPAVPTLQAGQRVVHTQLMKLHICDAYWPILVARYPQVDGDLFEGEHPVTSTTRCKLILHKLFNA